RLFLRVPAAFGYSRQTSAEHLLSGIVRRRPCQGISRGFARRGAICDGSSHTISERSGCAHVRYTPKRANMAQRRKAPILCPTDPLFRPCSRSMMRDRLTAEGGSDEFPAEPLTI